MVVLCAALLALVVWANFAYIRDCLEAGGVPARGVCFEPSVIRQTR